MSMLVPAIRVNDTSLVLLIPKKENKKITEQLFKISMTVPMPNLSIVISKGMMTKRIPEKNKDGFKSITMMSPVYETLITFSLGSDGIPLMTDSAAVELPTGDLILPEVYQSLKLTNVKSLINGYLLPQAQCLLLSKDCKNAMFSSWLLVGIQLMSLLSNNVILESEEKVSSTLNIIEKNKVLEIIVDSYQALLKENAYISDTHKLFAQKIMKRLSAVEVTAKQ